jgi:hypothetical protein
MSEEKDEPQKAGRACGPEEDARKLCPRMKKLSEAFFDGQDVVQ